MPYADPEKQKAAKRKWDQEHRKGRQHRVWWGYLYEDSAPDNWLDAAKESGYEMLAMKHDRDVTAAGEPKEPHWHVVVRLAHAGSLKDAQAALLPLGIKEQSIQYRDSWTAVARYLCHLDDPNKAQYDPADVIEIGGADYLQAIQRTADKYRVVAEMQDWVVGPMKDGDRTHSFGDLNDYARAENLEWFMALCDTSAVIMREFCKSKRYDWLDQARWLGLAQGGGPDPQGSDHCVTPLGVPNPEPGTL